MEDGAWVEMKESFKRISLAIFLIPFLASMIKNPHIFREEIIIPQEQSLINNRIIPIDISKIPEIKQAPSQYQIYYKKIFPLIAYLEKKDFQLENLLRDPRFKIYEIEKLKPKKKIRTLEEYKEVIGYEDKKNKISDFIDKNINQLELAERSYDEISKYITSATIGIESDFGDNKGDFNPFNVYFSMYANNYKKGRAKIQIEELLIFCEKHKIGIFDLTSNRAGAISYFQFMPSSLNIWFKGNGLSDLYNMANNIFSVANYLNYFKEKTGSLEQAIYKYNNSRFYVQTILDLAKDAEELYLGSK